MNLPSGMQVASWARKRRLNYVRNKILELHSAHKASWKSVAFLKFSVSEIKSDSDSTEELNPCLVSLGLHVTLWRRFISIPTISKSVKAGMQDLDKQVLQLSYYPPGYKSECMMIDKHAWRETVVIFMIQGDGRNIIFQKKGKKATFVNILPGQMACLFGRSRGCCITRRGDQACECCYRIGVDTTLSDEPMILAILLQRV